MTEDTRGPLEGTVASGPVACELRACNRGGRPDGESDSLGCPIPSERGRKYGRAMHLGGRGWPQLGLGYCNQQRGKRQAAVGGAARTVTDRAHLPSRAVLYCNNSTDSPTDCCDIPVLCLGLILDDARGQVHLTGFLSRDALGLSPVRKLPGFITAASLRHRTCLIRARHVRSSQLLAVAAVRPWQIDEFAVARAHMEEESREVEARSRLTFVLDENLGWASWCHSCTVYLRAKPEGTAALARGEPALSVTLDPCCPRAV